MSSSQWQIIQPDITTGLYGWTVDPYNHLPLDLPARTLVKVIDPNVNVGAATFRIQVRSRRAGPWIIPPICFAPVLTYIDPDGRQLHETHPRVIAHLQSEIRRLQHVPSFRSTRRTSRNTSTSRDRNAAGVSSSPICPATP